MILEYKKDSKHLQILLNTLELGYTEGEDYRLIYGEETCKVTFGSYIPEYIYLHAVGFQIKLDYTGDNDTYSGISQTDGSIFPEMSIPLKKGHLIQRDLSYLERDYTLKGSPITVSCYSLIGVDEAIVIPPPTSLSKGLWLKLAILSIVSTVLTALTYEYLVM